MTTNEHFDVYAVGNALVDNVIFVDDDTLKKLEIDKGVMTLVDEKTQHELLSKIGDHDLNITRQGGGSACNTAVAIAQLGGLCYYTGKVADDEQGKFYAKDLKEAGLHYHVEPSVGHTGTCLVLTTPDSERSMQTALGISTQLDEGDIDPEKIAHSKIVYIEGYLWDPEKPRKACIKTMEEAKKAGAKVAVTYSDPFLMDRHGEDFRRITKEYADIIFCNSEEAVIYGGVDDPKAAIEKIAADCPFVFMTMGAKGVMTIVDGRHIEVPPQGSITPLDSTGAGDMFAAGALYGLTQGYSLDLAASLGNKLAGEVIQVVGPRLDKDLKALIRPLVDQAAK